MAGSDKRNILNRAKCAKTFGVSVKTVSAWVDRGCPFVQKGEKGTEWLFDTAAVFRWHMQNVASPGDTAPQADDQTVEPANYEKARARKMMAEAAIAEIDLDIKAGTVVPIDMVLGAMADEYATVRSRLAALPGMIAPKLDATRATEFLPKIAHAVDDVLKELSADERIAAEVDRGPGAAPGDAGSEAVDAEAGSAADAAAVG